MIGRLRDRARALDRGWLARWILLPAFLAGVLSANVDLTAPPILGPERMYAVFLVNGQAYYGHLVLPLGSDWIELHDVYYFQQAPQTTGLPLALVRRGTELHDPADGMRIARDKILGIERVGPFSSIADAIAADRAVFAP